MPFLSPNEQRQSTEGNSTEGNKAPGYLLEIGQAGFVDTVWMWMCVCGLPAVTSQQYVGGQPVMQLQLAQQQAAAGAQELYANGYADAAAAAAASSSAKQMVPPRQSSSDYR